MAVSTEGAMRGPIGRVVLARLNDLLDYLRRHDITNAQVFGSVARGEDTTDSDLDLLADVPPGTSLFDLARHKLDLEDLLGVTVDLGTAVKPRLQDRVEAEAILVSDLVKYRSDTAGDPSRANLL
ncbi:MAG TPA: nucleotidyltransferase family protein [Nocardioides sp.]|uniref:nucleotidyltransferase family protein n=1 Tax=Nocardioides sp. TaxID=35761 RepID=UPI002C03FEE4|nr:nucleotidyltransferase family protein [Nocardioides sp.]HQR25451.1 nucleotidyltransferase family protein [Nocardioides sp.]